MSSYDTIGNFKKGLTQLIILHLLQEGPGFGYDMADHISELSNGKFVLNEGSLYPALYRMEKKGLLTSRTEVVVGKRTRRYYEITEAGRNQLKKDMKEYKQVADGVSAILKA